MAKFRVLTRSFIDNKLAETGDIVEYDGLPSDNLEAIDAPAQVLAADAVTVNADSKDRMTAAALGANPDTGTPAGL